jgi:methyl-CpG-binding domain protein 4
MKKRATGTGTERTVFLTQEKYRGDPWKVLVTCVMLNKTAGRVANPIIDEFLRRWPTAESFAFAERSEVDLLIQSLGLVNIRIRRLTYLSMCLNAGFPYDRIPGIGKYGRDSYLMFVEGRTDVKPTDKRLIAYLEDLERVRWEKAYAKYR